MEVDSKDSEVKRHIDVAVLWRRKVHNVAAKSEVKCKNFGVLSNSVYSTEYEVKGKSGRMLLISLSYPSSSLDRRVWLGWQGSLQLAGGSEGNLVPANRRLRAACGLRRRAQSSEGNGSSERTTLVSRNRDTPEPRLLPRTFWCSVGRRLHSALTLTWHRSDTLHRPASLSPDEHSTV